MRPGARVCLAACFCGACTPAIHVAGRVQGTWSEDLSSTHPRSLAGRLCQIGSRALEAVRGGKRERVFQTDHTEERRNGGSIPISGLALPRVARLNVRGISPRKPASAHEGLRARIPRTFQRRPAAGPGAASLIAVILDAFHSYRSVTLGEGLQATVELEQIQHNVASWPVPSLTIVRGTRLDRVNFKAFASLESSMRMENQYDAVLYQGDLLDHDGRDVASAVRRRVLHEDAARPPRTQSSRSRRKRRRVVQA